jgi:hypothetical protein
MSSDIIVQIPGATNVTVDDAPASAIVVTFPASTEVVTSVIDKGVLYGIQGASGLPGGVLQVNGQSGNVTLTTSEVPETATALYYTNERVDDRVNQLLQAGDNITLTYNDTANTLTIAAQGSVTSVNGEVGVVVLDKNDIGLGNVDNTSDIDKPVSTAQAASIATKASTTALTNHTTNYSNPHQVTKDQISLGNVQNVDQTAAGNIISGTLDAARLPLSVTLAGNVFNAAGKLVQLDGNLKLPAVDGSNLTNLPNTGGGVGSALYLFYNY